MKKRSRGAASLAVKMTELSMAAPAVVAMRVSRMAAAGNNPSASDKREMHLMGAEKVQAFSKSWLEMATAMWTMPMRMAQPLSAAMLRNPQAAASHLMSAGARAGTELLARGVAPIHKTATANARRLSRKVK